MNKGISKEKKNMYIAIGVIVVLLAGIFINSFISRGRESDIPSGKLSDTENVTTFSLDKEKFPYMYQFDATNYEIGVPSKGLISVEGGYAYRYGDFGVIVAEVSNARTMQAYSDDMYQTLYAIHETPTVRAIQLESGYINGYKADFGVFKANLSEIDKEITELMYMIKADKENIVLVATTENDTAENLKEGRDFLVEMVSSLIPNKRSSDKSASEDDYEELEENDYFDDEELFKDGAIIREAVISASSDYEKMCLIFSYMDVSAMPEDCYVLDANDKKYNAISISPGEYIFAIPNVSEGDALTIYIKSELLKGTTVSQCEYDDYFKEKEQYEEGTLHVEEGVSDDLSTDMDETNDEDIEKMKELVETVTEELPEGLQNFEL